MNKNSLVPPNAHLGHADATFFKVRGRLLKPFLLVVGDADATWLLTVSLFDDELASGYHIVDNISVKLPSVICPTEEDSSVFIGVIVCPCLIIHYVVNGFADALVKGGKIFL